MPKKKQRKTELPKERAKINIFATDPALTALKKKLSDKPDVKAADITESIFVVKSLDKLYLLNKGLYQSVYNQHTEMDYPEPPWDEDMLLDITKYNPYHYSCIEVKAEDSIRPGYRFLHTGKDEGADNKEKDTLVFS